MDGKSVNDVNLCAKVGTASVRMKPFGDVTLNLFKGGWFDTFISLLFSALELFLFSHMPPAMTQPPLNGCCHSGRGNWQWATFTSLSRQARLIVLFFFHLHLRLAARPPSDKKHNQSFFFFFLRYYGSLQTCSNTCFYQLWKGLKVESAWMLAVALSTGLQLKAATKSSHYAKRSRSVGF